MLNEACEKLPLVFNKTMCHFYYFKKNLAMKNCLPWMHPVTSNSMDPRYRYRIVCLGLSQPIHMTHAGDERLFVVEKEGQIEILNPMVRLTQRPFGYFFSNNFQWGTRSLGLAFHPDYENNGFFYVNYTDLNGDTQISRFSVDAGNPDVADPSSELLLDYIQPFSNHNGGCSISGQMGTSTLPLEMVEVEVIQAIVHRIPLCYWESCYGLM